jgi:hypothetical protein
MDLDSIEAGLDFGEVIAEAIDSSAVLVALIGRQWTTLADEEGRRMGSTNSTLPVTLGASADVLAASFPKSPGALEGT